MIAKLVAAKNPAARFADVTNEAINFLSENAVPQPVLESLTEVGYADWVKLGFHSIAPVNALRAINTEELHFPWFQRRYLTIGGGLNGDPIALDLESLLMCFIFHDDKCELTGLPDDHVLHTPLGYFDFWLGVASDDQFPVDAYEAEERWGRHRRFSGNG